MNMGTTAEVLTTGGGQRVAVLSDGFLETHFNTVWGPGLDIFDPQALAAQQRGLVRPGVLVLFLALPWGSGIGGEICHRVSARLHLCLTQVFWLSLNDPGLYLEPAEAG